MGRVSKAFEITSVLKKCHPRTRLPPAPNLENRLSESPKETIVYLKVLQKIAALQVVLTIVNRAGRSWIFILNLILPPDRLQNLGPNILKQRPSLSFTSKSEEIYLQKNHLW